MLLPAVLVHGDVGQHIYRCFKQIEAVALATPIAKCSVHKLLTEEYAVLPDRQRSCGFIERSRASELRELSHHFFLVNAHVFFLLIFIFGKRKRHTDFSFPCALGG